MTTALDKLPAIVLVDDDYHSARLMTRMLAVHGEGRVVRFADSQAAHTALAAIADYPPMNGQCMVLVDLKASSTASRDFIAMVKQYAPRLLVVAMASSLDREVRSELIDAGATAVFQRQADLGLYRREAESIVSFWARSQRLDAVGT